MSLNENHSINSLNQLILTTANIETNSTAKPLTAYDAKSLGNTRNRQIYPNLL